MATTETRTTRTFDKGKANLDKSYEVFSKEINEKGSEEQFDSFARLYKNISENFKVRSKPQEKIIFHQKNRQHDMRKDTVAWQEAESFIKTAENKIQKYSEKALSHLTDDYETILDNIQNSPIPKSDPQGANSNMGSTQD